MIFSTGDHPEVLRMPRRLRSPYAWVEHIPFAFHLMKLLRPRLLVELGVHTGNSFSAFCQAARELQTTTVCYGVDTWQGDEHAGFYDDSIFEDLVRDTNLSYSEFATLLRMKFDDALSAFSDSSIDLLHVDGLHTYEAVKHDFDTWLPKVSERGVVLFHDTAVRTEDFGVWRLWEELAPRYPSFQFSHGFGLGVLAVGPNVPAEVVSFLENASREPSFQTTFARLGGSVRWFAEAERATPELERLTRERDLLSDRVASLAQKVNDLGLSEQYFAEISFDRGRGIAVEQTVSRELDSREEWLDFAVPAGKRGAVQTATLTPFLGPVALRLGRIEVINRDGQGFLITEFSSNHLFSKDGLYYFESNRPEITVRLEHIEEPTLIRFSVSFVAMGPKFFELLYQRLCRGLEDAGLAFIPSSGTIAMTATITTNLRTPYEQAADTRAIGGALPAIAPKSYDQQLLSATLFLHEDLRKKDALLVEREEKARSAELALAVAQDQVRALEAEDARLRQVISDRDEHYRVLEKHFSDAQAAIEQRDVEFRKLEEHTSKLTEQYERKLEEKQREIDSLREQLGPQNENRELIPHAPGGARARLLSGWRKLSAWRKRLPQDRAASYSAPRKQP